MTYIIAEPCVGVKDKACVEVCPVDCIHDDASWATLLIDPQGCIDCALCVDACPVEAIFAADEVPARWRGWIARNYAAFGLDPP